MPETASPRLIQLAYQQRPSFAWILDLVAPCPAALVPGIRIPSSPKSILSTERIESVQGVIHDQQPHARKTANIVGGTRLVDRLPQKQDRRRPRPAATSAMPEPPAAPHAPAPPEIEGRGGLKPTVPPTLKKANGAEGDRDACATSAPPPPGISGEADSASDWGWFASADDASDQDEGDGDPLLTQTGLLCELD